MSQRGWTLTLSRALHLETTCHTTAQFLWHVMKESPPPVNIALSQTIERQRGIYIIWRHFSKLSAAWGVTFFLNGSIQIGLEQLGTSIPVLKRELLLTELWANNICPTFSVESLHNSHSEVKRQQLVTSGFIWLTWLLVAIIALDEGGEFCMMYFTIITSITAHRIARLVH